MKQQIERIEITVDNSTDINEVRTYLLRINGVKKVGVVTMNSVRVTYDENRIQPKKLVKALGHLNNERKRKRKTNVIMIKPVSEDPIQNAA